MNVLTINIPGAPIAKKRCTKCKQTLVVSEFHKNKAKKDGFHSECKICSSENCKEYRNENHEKIKQSQRNQYVANCELSREKSRQNYYRNKTKVLSRMKKIKQSNQVWFYELIGGSYCRLCGYDSFISSLQLHHFNETQKENGSDVLSNWLKTPDRRKIIKKITNTSFTILCANCHSALHAGELIEKDFNRLSISLGVANE